MFEDEETRMIDVYWYTDEKSSYHVDIEVFANDRSGLLSEIIREVEESKSKLIAISSKANKDRIAITELTIQVEDLEQLNRVLKALRKIDSVYEVKRKK